MIVFNLTCKICSSEFEGWFDSSKEFESQKRKIQKILASRLSFDWKRYCNYARRLLAHDVNVC